MSQFNATLQGETALAIVGMGCLFPKANDLESFWANVKEGVDCIDPIPASHWNPADYFDSDPKRPDFTYAQRGGFLDPYPFSPAEFGIAPRDLEAIDTAQLLGLVVAKMALEDAGLLRDEVDRKRISVILGVTGTLEMVVPLGARLGHPIWRKALKEAGVSDSQADAVMQSISDGYVGWQENSFPGLLGNVVAGRIANRLDLGGTNCVVDAACASSLSAVHLAALELASGRADAVLTGGVDTFNDIFMYMCFSKTPALSPTGDARPFSVDADGTILGEGLGMMVLKRLADAEQAGDRIYAVIRGLGTSSDGAGNAVYAPTVEGQVRCLRDAYSRSNVDPDEVELIEAHGTGTKVGDAVEIEALSKVFGKRRRHGMAVGSIKSQIGHAKAAAGAAGMIKAALALHHRTLPPTIKVREPAAELSNQHSSIYVNVEARPWLNNDHRPRRAGVSSFGFGGSNFHCVLEEHVDKSTAIDFSGSVQIFAWSSHQIDDLRSQIEHTKKEVAACQEWNDIRRLALGCRQRFDRTHSHRTLVLMDRNHSNRKQLFDDAIAATTGDDFQTNDHIFVGHGQSGKLGLLFPGQGSQAVGMLREMACAFPVFQNVLMEADRAFAASLVPSADTRLSDHIYPPSAFSAEQREHNEGRLRDTKVAQPALGAVSLAALQVLRCFGVVGDALAGHSYGELTALCAAGCFDAPSLFELSQLRGRLMGQSTGDRGAMLAVMAPLETVEAVVREEVFGVVMANRNAPNQAVLSGPTIEIERAERTLKQRRIRHIRLPVAAAFHSPLVADASQPFRAALEPIDFRTAQLPVFANSTSREYPSDPQAIRDLLAAQLSKPVDFLSQIRNMLETGVRTFLEVGPGHTLTNLVGAIAGDRPHQAIALDKTSGQRSGQYDLAHALARLASLGHSVQLDQWDPVVPPARKSRGPIVPICGANYRSPRPMKDQVAPSKPRSEPSSLSTTMPELPRKVESVPASIPDANNLQRALQVAQDSLSAFQRLQQQTADLHRIFLEQQSQAQQTLQQLLAGQQQLVATGLHLPTPAPPQPPRIATPIELPPAAPVSVSVPSVNGQSKQSEPVRVEPKTEIKASSDLSQTLLTIVAEKTGYPMEMLSLDMGLDSDLGIDSIKRVEILSALQDQQPSLPSVPPDRLGSLRTLREIIQLLESPAATSNQTYDRERPNDLAAELLSIVAEKTGYPEDMLQLDMSLDSDLGIDSIKRVEILSSVQERMPHLPSVAADRLGSLRTLRDVVAILDGASEEKKNSRRPVTV